MALNLLKKVIPDKEDIIYLQKKLLEQNKNLIKISTKYIDFENNNSYFHENVYLDYFQTNLDGLKSVSFIISEFKKILIEVENNLTS